MKPFIYIFALFLFAQTLMAQSLKVGNNAEVPPRLKPARNIFIELGGQGLMLTANYDTRFGNRSDGLGGRIGVGYVKMGSLNATTIPISLNYLLGKKGKFFEIGLGATFGNISFLGDETGFETVGTMSFSYRYQPEDAGVNFRIGITPIFGTSGGGYFMPYFSGLSVGYTFP
jgi:hypothetical protein